MGIINHSEYVLSNGINLRDTYICISSNQIRISKLANGNYSVVVSDANDCEKQLDLEMPCVQFPDIIPFQFISPNEDGKNDYWVLQNLEEYENAEVFIFNRWGSLVFHDDHYQNDWRGTCNKCSSDAEVLPSATYYYKVVTNKKSKSDFTGFIEIQP